MQFALLSMKLGEHPTEDEDENEDEDLTLAP